MKKILCALCALWCVSSFGAVDKPVIRIDFNEPSRKNSEVLENGFTAWPVPKDCHTTSLEVDGIQFRIDGDHNMRGGWNKAFVQAAVENSKLLGDGISFEDKATDGSITLTISGLPAGEHSIQTYHNTWQDPETTCGWPIYIYCNGELTETLERTFRQTSMGDAAIKTCLFHVNGESDSVVFVFKTDMDDDPADFETKTKYDVAPILNGFELNTVSVSSQAKRPSPADGDYHVDADSGSCTISWSPAGDNVVKHHLYWGTDSALVAFAQNGKTEGVMMMLKENADTTYLAQELSNLKTYYWRVDEEDSQGHITQGIVWSFRPRHLAFRTAEGYGRFATGGRGGKVVYVTNLNDSGEGSFRNAVCGNDGPVTVVFAVSGLITLNSRLVMDKYVTVAGQTAPGKGVCFRNSPMGLGDEDICRFIRVRLGGTETGDGLGMGGVDHGIIDHCSIGWSIDEAFSSRNARNITLQRTMISEAQSVANHKNYPEGTDHGFAGSISGDIGSFHHNLLAHNSGRNWSLAGGLDGNGMLQGRLDIFNMVVYNWCRHACYNGAHEVNFVNNYYKRGPATNQTNATKIMLSADPPSSKTSTQRYYFAGNVMPGVFDESNQEKGRTPNGADEARYDELYYKQWVDEPFFPSYAKMESARDAYKNVLSDVGCTLPRLDDHDVRIIDETLHGTYHYVGSRSGHYGLIDSENDCGGYEDYGDLVLDLDLFDTDRDGLPNWWEELHGSNPKGSIGDFSDSNADSDHDGYTALEDYLEWMANPHYQINPGESLQIDMNPYFVGFTQQPVLEAESLTEGVMASVDGMQVKLSAKEGFRGIGYTDVTLSDGEGASYTRRFGVLFLKEDVSRLTENTLKDASVVAVYDFSGRWMASSLHELPQGLYLVKYRTDEGSFCRKIFCR